MYYWNKDNFEGLEAIARSLQESTDVKDFSDYCRLRAEGLRKQAFEALSRFLLQALNWEFEKRRDFVDWLLAAQYISGHKSPGRFAATPKQHAAIFAPYSTVTMVRGSSDSCISSANTNA